jgi:uncharacterized protein YndB with AHSA1/START domain
MERIIKQEWLLDHSPETVWEYLTTPHLIAQWLMPNDFKPIAGHKFQFRTNPRIKAGFDGIVYCEVLEVIPHKKLSYSWKGGPAPGRITLDSKVSWTLIPTPTGTRLQLLHEGFRGMKNFLAYVFMNAGWAKKIRKRFKQMLDQPVHDDLQN